MRQGRRCHFFGYVKVELRSRSPRQWGWSIYRDTADSVVVRSDCRFICAEDAWRAGRETLTALEMGIPVEGARALETVDDGAPWG